MSMFFHDVFEVNGAADKHGSWALGHMVDLLSYPFPWQQTTVEHNSTAHPLEKKRRSLTIYYLPYSFLKTMISILIQ